MSPTVNKLLYDLKCPAISFVFVEMTGAKLRVVSKSTDYDKSKDKTESC